MRSSPHVVWLDNYSHFLKVQMPSGDRGRWRDCQWTVVALHVTRELLEQNAEESKALGFFLRSARAGHAMPKTMFLASDIESVVACLTHISGNGNLKSDYYDSSLSKDVRRLPLKPPAIGTEAERYLKESIFLPKAVSPLNISSNKGLIQCLVDLLRQYPKNDVRPIILMADVAIYVRLLKVR